MTQRQGNTASVDYSRAYGYFKTTPIDEILERAATSQDLSKTPNARDFVGIAAKVARQVDEATFIKFASEGMLPPIKLTNTEMALIKGGMPTWLHNFIQGVLDGYEAGLKAGTPAH